MKLISITIASMIICLGGCSTEKHPSLTGSNGTDDQGQQATITLSTAQKELYQNGLRKIIHNPDTAKFIGVKARKFTEQPGIHICGYVKNKDGNGEEKETPFYIELRNDNQTDSVHRGQIGSDPAKKAKVKFVCRHHKNI